MTAIDTDQYYTPPSVAKKAFERAKLTVNPGVCADTACGSGSLLNAAQVVLSATHCLGIDNDPLVIRQLRRDRPEWRLYVGDLLKCRRAPPAEFFGERHKVDLLVLNPPFTLGPRKYVEVDYLNQTLRCSVAMAHILRSLQLYRPSHGAIAVVPESLLYSETDQHAREVLDREFSFSELLQLSIYTFKGARVNSSFVQFSAPRERPRIQSDKPFLGRVIPATVTRGGLQMHSFDRKAAGAPVVHSTTLKVVAAGGTVAIKERTLVRAKGRVSGWLLLLPRVGSPKADDFHVFHSLEEIQLSDCVIAMQFSSKDAAVRAQRRIESNWASLIKLYRGTGARYITIDRLVSWLHEVGIQDNQACNEFNKLRLR